MKKIQEIASSLQIPEEGLECYGTNKAKIRTDRVKTDKKAKLILMTAMNPTPFGEGKTTQSIGLAMAMNQLGKNTVVVLREPSLGPVFGVKGGAIGGGKAKIFPEDEINLHFTGDFHAITSANNLLCAVVDNHIFQGNELQIDPKNITIKRAMDMNDRSLRNIAIYDNMKSKVVEQETGFEITAACELMAICCLSKDEEDLKRRINQIIVGYNFSKKPVYAKELNVTNAMMALLKETLKPNLVQTIEGTPCIVHLGPFANIAHGCNSIIATKLGINTADYCITEAGFGADLGAEKFFDITCRVGDFKPDLAIIVATIKALKYNASIPKAKLEEENIDAVKKGFENLKGHIENVSKYGVDTIVCINQFAQDSKAEIDTLKTLCEELGVKVEISQAFEKGGAGAIELAKQVVDSLEASQSRFHYLYDLKDSTSEKIEKICREIYGANEVIYTEEAKAKLKEIEILNLSNYPVCIAKTPASFSDDDKLLGRPRDFAIHVRDIKIDNGAEFIVVYTGNILTMPGLSKHSKYEEF